MQANINVLFPLITKILSMKRYQDNKFNQIHNFVEFPSCFFNGPNRFSYLLVLCPVATVKKNNKKNSEKKEVNGAHYHGRYKRNWLKISLEMCNAKAFAK